MIRFYTFDNYQNVDFNFEYENEIFEPNKRFLILAYSTIFDSTHIDLYNVLKENGYSAKALKINEGEIWVAKNLEKDYKIIDFFKWIHQKEIYNFEISDFEYNLNVLVSRFFKENYSSSSPEIIIKCANLIAPLINVDWPNKLMLQKKQLETKERSDLSNM